MAVEFRFARAGEYPLISRFLNDNWAENHIYCRSEPLFEWTFRRPGFWPDDGYSVVMAFDGAELVGILGGILFDFNCLGGKKTGVWVANYVVREDHRRGSTALKLLSELRRPYEVTVAFGINPATANIYRVLRGAVLPLIPRHFAVFPGAGERMVKLLRTAEPDAPENWARSQSRPFEMAELPARPEKVSSTIPETWDANDWSVLAGASLGCARDRDFLTWRYADHPIFDYRIVAVPEGDRTGLAVWRLETIHAEENGRRKPVETIGRLVEFMPASEENARALGGAFLHEAAAAGAFGADYFSYHGPARTALAALGMREVNQNGDGDRIPSRFQPLDGKKGSVMSAIFPPDDVPGCTAEADCPWYWTKSDSDQDRPN